MAEMGKLEPIGLTFQTGKNILIAVVRIA